MLSNQPQNIYNMNMNQLENIYSNCQESFQGTAGEENITFKGITRRVPSLVLSVSAMKPFTEVSCDELRVNIYANTNTEILDCVYKNVKEGFNEPKNLIQQQPSNNFLGQNSTQNYFGASNMGSTAQNNFSSGLGMPNNNTQLGGNVGNSMFQGLNTMGNSLQSNNTNTVGGGFNSLTTPSSLGGGLTGNTGLSSGLMSGSNNLGGLNSNTLQGNSSNLQGNLTLGQNNFSSFQNAGSSLTSGGVLGQTSVGGLQNNSFKNNQMSSNTLGTLGQQSIGSSTLGGTNVGLQTGINSGLLSGNNMSNNLLLSKNSTSNILGAPLSTGGDLFKGGGANTTLGTTSNNPFAQNSIGGNQNNFLSSNNNKGLFANTNQTTQGLGSNIVGLTANPSFTGIGSTNTLCGNNQLGIGNSTGLGMQFGMNNNSSLGTGLLQKANPSFPAGGLLNNQTIGTGTTNNFITPGSSISGMGLSNTLGTSTTGSLLNGLPSTGLGLGANQTLTQNNNTLGLLGSNNPSMGLTNIGTNSFLNNSQTKTYNTGAFTKTGPRSLTLNTQNLNGLGVNEEELLEFRRQKQINMYVDSMCNPGRSSKRQTNLSDASLIQSTSRTADKILNYTIDKPKQRTSYASGIPTNFSQISRMYTNKGYSDVRNYFERNGKEYRHDRFSFMGMSPRNCINKPFNFFSEDSLIELGDESAKLVRNALLASRRNSVLNRTDVLPLVSIKTEMNDSDIHPQRSKYSSRNDDLESTRCDHCSNHQNTSSSYNASFCQCESHVKSNSGIRNLNNGGRSFVKSNNRKHSNDAVAAKNKSCSKKGCEMPLSNSSSLNSTNSSDTSSSSMILSTNDPQKSYDDQSINNNCNCPENEIEKTTDLDPLSLRSVNGGRYQQKKCNIILERRDYYTKPSLRELDDICSDGKCIVKGFVIGRKHYGFATFPDEIDVYGLNLDEIVIFNRALVEIYPDDYPNKPLQGQGLNRRAIITLYSVFPFDPSENGGLIKDSEILSSSSYIEFMETLTLNLGALFLDYNPIEGTWTFEVPHFTKYGINLCHNTSSTVNNESGDKSNLRCSTKMNHMNCNLYSPNPSHANNQHETLSNIKSSQSMPDYNSFRGFFIDHQSTNNSDCIFENTNIETRFSCVKRKHNDFVDGTYEYESGSSDIDQNTGYGNAANNMFNREGDDIIGNCNDTITTPNKIVKNGMNNSGYKRRFHGFNFPKVIIPDNIDEYAYFPVIHASTKRFHNSSVPLDERTALVECFIGEQSKIVLSDIRSCKLRFCSTNTNNVTWDVAKLFGRVSQIGSQSFTMACVRPRSLHLIEKSDPSLISTMSPHVVHVFKSQYNKYHNIFMDDHIINKVFNLLHKYSNNVTSNPATNQNRKINSIDPLKIIDDLLEYISKSSCTTNTFLKPLFELIKILFVDDNELGYLMDNVENKKHNSVEMYRKNQLLHWIKKMTEIPINKAIKTLNNNFGTDPYRAVKIANYYISSQRCDDAADILIENNFHQLSLISTLAHADNVSKYRVSCQIDKWRKMNLLDEVGDDVLSLLAMVSGMNSYPVQCGVDNNGDHLFKSYPYWVDFDWVSVFGLFLFNFSKPNLSIGEVFKCFVLAIKNISANYSHCRLFNELADDSLTRFFSKLCRSLFYMYCGNRNPFDELVDEFVIVNENYSPAIPIIWLVVILLDQLRPNSISNLLYTTVTMRFIEMLEISGKWEHAVFVLSLIDSSSTYNTLINDIILRNFDDHHEKMDFLRQHKLLSKDCAMFQHCMVAYTNSHPFENIELLRTIVTDHGNALMDDLARNNIDITRYINVINTVIGRLNQFNTESHSEHRIIEDLRSKCADLLIILNKKNIDNMTVSVI